MQGDEGARPGQDGTRPCALGVRPVCTSFLCLMVQGHMSWTRAFPTSFSFPTTSQSKKLKQVHILHMVFRCSHYLQVQSPPTGCKGMRVLRCSHHLQVQSSPPGHKAMADLREDMRDAHPPLVQNFFILMQFSGEIGKIIGSHPLWVSAPSSGKSWICHCKGMRVLRCPHHLKVQSPLPGHKSMGPHALGTRAV